MSESRLFKRIEKTEVVVMCLECGQILFARSVRDFVMCSCKNECYIDGGRDYIRRGAMRLNNTQMLNLKPLKEVKETKKKPKKK